MDSIIRFHNLIVCRLFYSDSTLNLCLQSADSNQGYGILKMLNVYDCSVCFNSMTGFTKIGSIKALVRYKYACIIQPFVCVDIT